MRARWFLRSLLGLALFGVMPSHREASAHELTPAVLALRERAPGRFDLRWTSPLPPLEQLVIRFPSGCQVDDSSDFDANASGAELPHILTCGAAGLSGDITFQTSSGTPARISVNVEWLDGTQSYSLSSQDAPPRVTVHHRSSLEGPFRIFWQYSRLGLEHIWLGIDHLLFVLGLLLLVVDRRSLLWSVSSFTLAHSLTLALASLGFVGVPTGPVEICIALSVLLLAVEATRTRATLTRRYPWLIAFCFGLLHGFGFASALSEVGLPKGRALIALLGFNIGVELGQLAVVGVAVLGAWGLAARPRVRAGVGWAATSVLGVCSVLWLLQRVESWLSTFGLSL